MSEHRPTLDPDFSLEEVSAALGMSTRWIRDRIKEGAEHIRYGHKIRFTAEQVEQLRAGHIRNERPEVLGKQSITTGRRRRAS